MEETTPKENSPFGIKHPRYKRSLREFEKNLGIRSRSGEGFWSSSYVSVQNLLDHLCRGIKSECSRDEYLRTVNRLCRRTDSGPDELIALDTEKAESLVQEFGDELVKKGRTHLYANNVLERLKTFYRSNGHKDFEVDNYSFSRRALREVDYVPERDEVHLMAESAGSQRNRAIVYMLWTTGVRVSTLAALNYGDIRKGLENGEKYVKIDVLPKLKERVSDACKAKVPYHTFAHPIALRPLQAYLRIREVEHGPLEDDYPLFHSKWHLWKREERTRKRLDRRSFERVVKKSARKAGISEWKEVSPRSLRKSFKSVLRSATIDGGALSIETQEFLMGHILPMRLEEYYDKGDVEHHRKMYAKLDFSKPEGWGTQEAEPSDKLVDIDDLSRHLDEGWRFVETVADDKFIITKDHRGR